ncbi:MAG: hypothetical protein IJP93_11625 [Bacteroidales bacterium]|nr:hypothetical protein [Bacteroidales bacterium]
MGKKRRGHSYRKRVADINRIYGEHEQSGLSNREIWRRYIYPVFAISERTFYNIIKVPVLDSPEDNYPTLFDNDGQ